MKTLSDKILDFKIDGTWTTYAIKQDDVREFIKQLKEEIDTAQKDFGTLEVVDKEEVQKIIDKRAGPKLI